MSRSCPSVPKGMACGLHKTLEYRQGWVVGYGGFPNKNKYDFFDEYEEHYAWDIGWQVGKSDKENGR